MLFQKTHILLVGDSKAVEEIINIGLGKLLGVSKAGEITVDVVVLLDGLDDISVSLQLEHLLSDERIAGVKWLGDVVEIAVGAVQVGGVAEGTLVVGNGPGGSRHDAEVVVAVGVDRSEQGVLLTEGTTSLGDQGLVECLLHHFV